MHANLVSTPRQRAHADEYLTRPETFDDGVFADGRAARAVNDHLAALVRIAHDRDFNSPGWRFRRAFQQRQIDFFHAALLELAHQVLHGALVFSYQQQPAGVFVETVDDAAPFWRVIHLADLRPAVEDGVDERAGFVTRARMDYQPCGFVDDRQQVVLIEHVQVNRLDRKSTRLNSSHVKISYAVFCLKKNSAHCSLYVYSL